MTFKAANLPIEIFQLIAQNLPRHILKTLLVLQPHPLGQVASYIYFSTLSLHFGVYHHHWWYLINFQEHLLKNHGLPEWHKKRSYDILMSIKGGGDFAKRVKRLKIYAPGSSDSNQLVCEMSMCTLLRSI